MLNSYEEKLSDAIESHVGRRPSEEITKRIAEECGLADLVNSRVIREAMNAPIEFNNPEEWAASIVNGVNNAVRDGKTAVYVSQRKAIHPDPIAELSE